MRKMFLALATVACVAAVPAATMVPTPAQAENFSVRIGDNDGWRGQDSWRWRHAYHERHHYRPYFAYGRSCRTVIRERHGPVVVRRVINRC